MPRIKEILQNQFLCPIIDDINPDEVVAYGATIQAAMLMTIGKNKLLDGVKLFDITPISLGTDVINKREDPKIKMNDRAYKYFFISKNCDKLLNERQKAFLQMVASNKSCDAFTDKVKKLVDNAKRNTQWRKQYMDWEREKTRSYKMGREEHAIESAKNLLNMNLGTPEQIAQALNLPIEQVLQLQKEAQASVTA